MKITLDNIYYFKYSDPITKPKIWDLMPVVIPLMVNSKHLLAINLHFIPTAFRTKFIQTIYHAAETIQEPRKKARMKLRLTYEMLKNGPYKYALQGIRKYLISRMSNIQEIPMIQLITLKPTGSRYSSKYRPKIMKRS